MVMSPFRLTAGMHGIKQVPYVSKTVRGQARFWTDLSVSQNVDLPQTRFVDMLSGSRAAGAAKPHGIGVRVTAAARSRPGIQPTVLYTMKGPHKYYLYGALPGTVYLVLDTRKRVTQILPYLVHI
ncbi:hypothetical protein Bbelb_241460 [Branchiostoma belcheri]|nr:hypothetical protein Bbelb_241460 [Branchiostoma belcheri]